MKAAMDVITSGKREDLYKPLLLQVIYSFLRGAPYGFLILILWNIFSPELDSGQIALLIAGMIVTYVIQYLVGIPSLIRIHETGYSLCSEARLNLCDHLRKLPMGFFRKRDPGDTTSLMLVDMAFVEKVFTHIIGDIIAAFTIPAVITVFLLMLDWQLALVAVVTAVVSLPFLYLSQVLIQKYGRVLHDARVEADSRLLEYLQGIRYIKAYNLTGARFEKLETSLKQLHRAAIRVEVFPGALSSCYMSVLGIGYIILVLAATYSYIGGALTIPVYLVFLILGYQFYQPLMQGVLSVMEARFMNLAAERMKAVMDVSPLPEPENPVMPDDYSIGFSHVSFAYQETEVLSDVSFTVAPGEVLALVGASGSGKTTITSLIARFWDIQSGSITLGGIDIREIGTELLLSQISMVFQDVYLFNDTIANNIRIGNPDATDEEVQLAACRAQAHDFIGKFPDGYETVIGEGGSTLSGGEKQRISIARAILKDAPVILLDEATASLDPENEEALQQALSELIREKTVIVIAHRLNTIQDADRIVVLEEGKIAEIGKHGELLMLNGRYSRMWSEQQKAAGWKVSSKGTPNAGIDG